MEIAENIENVKVSGTEKLPNELLTKDEILKIIDAADCNQDKAFIAALAESGCRIGELLSCRIKDVERISDGIKFTFPRGKTGSRTVLLAYMASYITRWLEEHPLRKNEDAPLWITKRKHSISKDNTVVREYRPIEYNTAAGILSRVVKKAGIKKRVHAHLFRHSRATVLSRDLTESQLKKYLGWKPGSNMPAVYIHLSNEDSDNAIRGLYGLIEKEKTEKGFEVGKCPRC